MRVYYLFISFLFAYSAAISATNDEIKAINTLTNKFVQSNISKAECVGISTDIIAKKYYVFSVREKHSTSCGGDPSTNPLIGIFRVYKANHKILWLSSNDGDQLSFDAFIQNKK